MKAKLEEKAEELSRHHLKVEANERNIANASSGHKSKIEEM